MNENTNEYVSRILCNENFVNFISEKFISWMIDALSFDGFTLVQQTQSIKYPLLLLFSFNSEFNSSGSIHANIVGKWEGLYEVNELINSIKGAYNKYFAQKEREEAEAIAREQERKMKQQMDEEYERAVEMDRQKMENKKEELDKEDFEAAIKMSLEHEREVKMKEWEKKFENEPTNIDGLCGNFRFSFPNGIKIQRKFLLSDNLNVFY